MIDTHAHIDFDPFDDDRQEMLDRAGSAGVEAIVVPAVEPKDFDRLANLAASRDDIYCAFGVHPHNADEATDDILNRIKQMATLPKSRAIGEIGLDYYYDFTPPDLQKEKFRAQLEIAKELDMPVIVHNREADDDVLGILDDYKGDIRAVLHCFSSDASALDRALDLGHMVSFTGNITFKKSTLGPVVERVPLNRVMIETDSPFMTPVPHRGKRNEPSYVGLIAEKISEIKSINIEEVLEMTTQNARKFFNLFTILLAFLFTAGNIWAQDEEEEYTGDEYADEEMTEEEEEAENPYHRFIGFGPVGGPNTIVETYYFDALSDDQDISYDGLLAMGASVIYSPFDFLLLETSYLYSKNNDIAEKNDWEVEPSIHHILEVSSHWIPNPYSRINFFGTIGATFFFNSINGESSNQIGLNGGIGIIFNQPTGIGLFNLIAQWRVSFESERSIGYLYDSATKMPVERESKSFFSIPRFSIIWYPDLGF